MRITQATTRVCINSTPRQSASYRQIMCKQNLCSDSIRAEIINGRCEMCGDGLDLRKYTSHPGLIIIG